MNCCNDYGQCQRAQGCPAGSEDDEVLARISRDVARQLAEADRPAQPA